jgi:hypothetical protein
MRRTRIAIVIALFVSVGKAAVGFVAARPDLLPGPCFGT